MIEQIKYIGILILTMCAVYGGIYLFATAVKDYEIIEPEEGIHCVVVSRMMMTSVSCYKIDEKIGQ